MFPFRSHLYRTHLWVLYILSLSTLGEIIFPCLVGSIFEATQSAVPETNPEQCSSTRFIWKCQHPQWHSPIQGGKSSEPKPDGISVCARSQMQLGGAGERWRRGLWARINAERGGGSALDKNSICLNSCPHSLMISPLTCVWLSEKQRAPRTVTQLESNGGSPPARWVFQACAALNFSTCEQVFTVLKMC